MSSYADRIVPTLEDLAALLTSAGVRAGLERSQLEVPGAWVTPASVGDYTLDGEAHTITTAVLLVAPAGGDLAPLKVLTGLLAKAETVISPDEDVDTSVVLNVRNTPLPAFRLTVVIPIKEP